MGAIDMMNISPINPRNKARTLCGLAKRQTRFVSDEYNLRTKHVPVIDGPRSASGELSNKARTPFFRITHTRCRDAMHTTRSASYKVRFQTKRVLAMSGQCVRHGH